MITPSASRSDAVGFVGPVGCVATVDCVAEMVEVGVPGLDDYPSLKVFCQQIHNPPLDSCTRTKSGAVPSEAT